MKRFLLSILLFIVTTSICLAENNPQWIRYQAISPDGNAIAFTYKGDIYRVSVHGGLAQQLTFHEGHDFMPVWSNDGARLAFASDRYGNFNVYVMDAFGGPAERITFHSNDEFPYSFTHDDSHVIFGANRMDTAENRDFPAAYIPELYKVPAQGGRVQQIFSLPAELVQVSGDGNRLIYQDVKRENEWRKHQRSAVSRDLWMFDRETGTHTMLTSDTWENRNPVFNEDESLIYYLSEENGTFNVYQMSIENPSEREQLTFFEVHPVRFLSYANGTFAFGFDGELYTMKLGEEPSKVNVAIRTQEISNSDRFITINGGVQEFAVSPDGKEIAFIARGEVFATSVDGSITKRITNTSEQERFVSFTPDGKGIVYSRYKDGKWSIFKTTRVRTEEPFFFASTLLKEEVLVSDDVDNYLASFSPDGKKLAYIADRRTFRIKDMASGRTTDLLTSDDLFHMRDGDQYFTWSPDSKWILYSWGRFLHNSEVLLLAADGSKRLNLTESGYYDMAPKWVNNGKQMIWFSNRDGLRSYATSGQSERDVYTMFFSQEEWDTFRMSEDDFKLFQEIQKAQNGDDKKDDESKPLTFDWNGMEDRIARLTIHSSLLSDAVLSKDGSKVYYLTRFEENYNLWETNLRTRETKMTIRLNTGPGSLVWDDKMENLYLLSRGRISKLNLSGGSSTPITIAGEKDFDAVREREIMFDHVYIRTKNIFYEPTFHGMDWSFLYEEYKKYIPHIGNSYEFAEMLSEMLGELNVSHAGARFSRSIDNPDETASLGIFWDYNHTGNGIKITEVIQGGPLDKAAFDIKPGMIIEKIDGELITPDVDKARFLNRKANRFVLLEITGPGRNDRKQITVKPITLAQERGLLYNRFVRMNEQEVIERSGGRLGYVHIPGMSDGPFRNVIQRMLGKFVDTEAVIVDGRFNSGGDLVADLVMFFTGVAFNTYATEAKVVGGEPTSRWTKPTLSLYNESMYSDGHCYAAAYSELSIGTTIGMPVPGTCSFAGWEMLPDGTRWGVVPISAKNKFGEWMENNQTYPDIIVRNEPGKVDKGIDQQLLKAIEQLLRELDEAKEE